MKKMTSVEVLAIRLDTVYVSSKRTRNSTRENIIYKNNCVTNKKVRRKLFCHLVFRVRKRRSQSVLPGNFSILKSCLLWAPQPNMVRFLQGLHK